jgi:hypothetical protein
VAVFELDPEHGVGEGLDNGPLEDDRVFFGFRQGLLLVLLLVPRLGRAWTAGRAPRAD